MHAEAGGASQGAPHAATLQPVQPKLGEPNSAAPAASVAAPNLQNIGLDCWYECKQKSGFCDYCGLGNACCRNGYQAESPKECQGNLKFTTWHHECIVPDRSAAPAAAAAPPPTAAVPPPAAASAGTSPAAPHAATLQPVQPKLGEPNSAAPAAAAATPSLQHIGLDCWYECNQRSGFCDYCGQGNACCRNGKQAESPTECQGNLQFTTWHHECVVPDRSAAAGATPTAPHAATLQPNQLGNPNGASPAASVPPAAAGESHDSAMAAAGAAAQAAATAAGKSGEALIASITEAVSKAAASAGMSADQQKQEAVKAARTYAAAAGLSVADAESAALHALDAAQNKEFQTAGVAMPPAPTISPGVQAAMPTIKPVVQAAGAAAAATPSLQHIGLDCWYECNQRSGFCDYCGQGNACCRNGKQAESPTECQGNLQFTTWHHECVVPDHSKNAYEQIALAAEAAAKSAAASGATAAEQAQQASAALGEYAKKIGVPPEVAAKIAGAGVQAPDASHSPAAHADMTGEVKAATAAVEAAASSNGTPQQQLAQVAEAAAKKAAESGQGFQQQAEAAAIAAGTVAAKIGVPAADAVHMAAEGAASAALAAGESHDSAMVAAGAAAQAAATAAGKSGEALIASITEAVSKAAASAGMSADQQKQEAVKAARTYAAAAGLSVADAESAALHALDAAQNKEFQTAGVTMPPAPTIIPGVQAADAVHMAAERAASAALAAGESHDSAMVAAGAAAQAAATAAGKSGEALIASITEAVSKAAASAGMSADQQKQEAVKAARTYAAAAGLSVADAESAALHALDAAQNKEFQTAGVAMPPAPTISPGVQAAMPTIKPVVQAAGAAAAATPSLQHIGLDCWYECNQRSGFCDYCGQGNACCRNGKQAESPTECQGNLQFTTWHHECVVPDRSAAQAAAAAAPPPAAAMPTALPVNSKVGAATSIVPATGKNETLPTPEKLALQAAMKAAATSPEAAQSAAENAALNAGSSPEQAAEIARAAAYAATGGAVVAHASASIAPLEEKTGSQGKSSTGNTGKSGNEPRPAEVDAAEAGAEAARGAAAEGKTPAEQAKAAAEAAGKAAMNGGMSLVGAEEAARSAAVPLRQKQHKITQRLRKGRKMS